MSNDIPTIEANEDDFENLIYFIYKHEEILKEYGGIKIKPHINCKQSIRKRRINLPLSSNIQEIIKINSNELIYSIETKTNNKIINNQLKSINENDFWKSLTNSNKLDQSNVTIYPNKSFYFSRPRPKYFDLPRLPKLSLLKIGGSQILRQCLPTLIYANGPASIYPLSSSLQRLFSIDYHHEGGNRHWYIIPAKERIKLNEIIQNMNLSLCIEHKNLLINPEFFHKYNIRYHKIIQKPNEFIILSAGALSQGFSENSSWNESTLFALPSWLQDGHASDHLYQSNICLNHSSILQSIDISQFRYELVQRWIQNNLNQNSLSFQGLF